MGSLHERFLASLNKIGLRDLPCPVFDNASYGIRFRIGGDEKIYLGDHRKPNGVYVENAVERAVQIYAHLPGKPNIFRMDDQVEIGESPEINGLFLKSVGLPEPDEIVEESRKNGTIMHHCYWKLSDSPEILRKLFREVIRAEIDPNGCEWLVSNVYFIDDRLDFLWTIYDDTVAEAAAASPNMLHSLAQACGQWIESSRL